MAPGSFKFVDGKDFICSHYLKVAYWLKHWTADQKQSHLQQRFIYLPGALSPTLLKLRYIVNDMVSPYFLCHTYTGQPNDSRKSPSHCTVYGIVMMKLKQ